MYEIAEAIVLQAIVFTAIIAPLELLAPAHAPRPTRARVVDVAYLALLPFFLSATIGIVLELLGAAIRALMPLPLETSFRSQPFALRFVEVLVLSELLTYLAHRAAHASPTLWKLHRVHHANISLDWLAAHRQHPIESLYLLALSNVPLLLLGLSPDALLPFVLFQKLHTAFVHANTRLTLGPLSHLLAAPAFHHRHHDADAPPANFASLSPLLDRAFGTLARNT